MHVAEDDDGARPPTTRFGWAGELVMRPSWRKQVSLDSSEAEKETKPCFAEMMRMSSSPARDGAQGSADVKVRAFVKAAGGAAAPRLLRAARNDDMDHPRISFMIAGAQLRGSMPLGGRARSAQDARPVTHVGAIDGADLRCGGGIVTAVAILVVEVRVRRSDGGRSGLAILILAVDLVVVSVAGALLGEVRAFLFGECELRCRQDETGFANLLN
jgi:hypothetical protein